MTIGPVLEWIDGAGWLVLSGGRDPLSDVRAVALGRMDADGGVAYLGVDEDAVEDLIEDMSELGAPTGYMVNVMTEDDDAILHALQEAALIVIPDDLQPYAWKQVLAGAALKGLRSAFQHGSVVLAEGAATTLFGTVFIHENRGIPGFDWVKKAFFVPGVTTVAESSVARELLGADEAAIAVGIGVGSALAMGPAGRVETWGAREVTVALGRDHTNGSGP